MRKLNGNLTPLSTAIRGRATTAATPIPQPRPEAPPTPAELIRQAAALLDEAAAALEREDERVDCELAKLWGKIGGLEPKQPKPLLMDARDAAAYVGVEPWKIYEWRQGGRLTPVQIEGTALLFRTADLDKLAES